MELEKFAKFVLVVFRSGRAVWVGHALKWEEGIRRRKTKKEADLEWTEEERRRSLDRIDWVSHPLSQR